MSNPVVEALTGLLAAIGRPALAALAEVGRVAIFAASAIGHLLRPPFYWREFGQQVMQIGWFSLPVVGLTAIFTGGALALQIYAGGSRFAAEIGTMKVTEQIDALVTLSTNPMKYLTLPRLLAATLTVPVLVGAGDAIGIMGGWLVGISRLDFNSAAYLKNTVDFLEFWDIGSGLVKGAVFGFIVALMGCYHGMNSARGAQGVGAATKSAVVAASVLILAANYLLTEVFFSA